MAAYNRYRGNGSRAERVEEPTSRNGRQQSGRSGMGSPSRGKPAPPRKTTQQSVPSLQKLPFLGDLPKKLGELETEDLLLILILYLMYRESGDKELLIIMGAMYLL